jgi:hypothetical protein
MKRIAPVAPFPGAVGFAYSQSVPNIEQEVSDEEARALVASGAFRYVQPPPREEAPPKGPPFGGSSDSAADAARKE